MKSIKLTEATFNGYLSIRTYLPENLISKLEDIYSGKQLNDAILATYSIYNKFLVFLFKNRESMAEDEDYINKIILGKNHKIWDKLVEDKILKRLGNKTKSKITDLEYSYEINSNLMNDKLIKTYFLKRYTGKMIESNSLLALNKFQYINSDKSKTRYQISGDYDEIMETISNECDVDELNQIIKHDQKIIYQGIKGVYEEAKLESEIYVYSYLETRKKTYEYDFALRALESGIIELPRLNKTNKRLNHVLSSIPTKYLEHYTLDSDNIMEIKLINSQLCIFANILKNPDNPILNKLMHFKFLKNNDNYSDYKGKLIQITELIKSYREKPDVNLFINSYSESNYFETNTEESPIVDLSKTSMNFMKLFRYKIVNKDDFYYHTLIKESFPDMFRLIELIKLYYISLFKISDDTRLFGFDYVSMDKSDFEAGNDYLSLALERCEAEIFIDNILSELQLSGLTVISRHDAILCKESEYGMVYDTMVKELNRILGENNFSLKTELITKAEEIVNN
ncbi:MAG: hypothetical protein IPH57_09940 [Saprospiraceae bacterium]|nr:hypothetical protein [Saprospiraceae bacterium]